MQLFDFLPTSHDSCATAKVDFLSPDRVEVLVVDGADELGVA